MTRWLGPLGRAMAGPGLVVGSAAQTDEAGGAGFLEGRPLSAAPVNDLVRRYGEAVISIEAPKARGSGFAVNAEGHAITNHHVIHGGTRTAAVLCQGVPGGPARRRVEDFEIVALSPFFDLALIKFPPQKDLKLGSVVLGNLGEVIGMTSRGARADLADDLGFAVPVDHVRDFLRNREAFSYDKENPNTGHRYLDPPRRRRSGPPAWPGPTPAEGAAARRSG